MTKKLSSFEDVLRRFDKNTASQMRDVDRMRRMMAPDDEDQDILERLEDALYEVSEILSEAIGAIIYD
jgi:hypothetical protein